MSALFESFNLAGTELSSRIVMAPMTRARATGEVADELTARYYQQRAGAGLIITEGTPVSPEGRGYLYLPGIFSKAQVAGWKKTTDAVHEQGGRIFAQLWHVGRMSHSSLQENDNCPVGPSSKATQHSNVYARDANGNDGMVTPTPPRALATEEVQRVTQDFVKAAQNAIAAGFDGVEIHGANGYLFHQFINPNVNDRTDRYGGSIENRLRFLFETIDAVSEAIGAHRVGVRISPYGHLFECDDFDDEAETWQQAASEFQTRDLAYVHLSDQLTIGANKMPEDFPRKFREIYQGTLIAAGGFDKAHAEQAIASGEIDLVAFGRPFIANPDLVDRLRHDWPLNEADRDTFYGLLGERGYTDYPTWQQQQEAK